MGVFDDNIESFPLGTARKLYSRDKHIEFIRGVNILEKDELNSLFCAISFDPNSAGILYPRSILKADTFVIISNRIEYYEGPSKIEKLGKHMLANPEYDGHETIELFINSIRSSAPICKIDSGSLLVSVFIHELYHSFFHKLNPNKCIEEPLAELGALLFMNIWLEDDSDFMNYFYSICKKKEYPEICFYGLGAD